MPPHSSSSSSLSTAPEEIRAPVHRTMISQSPYHIRPKPVPQVFQLRTDGAGPAQQVRVDEANRDEGMVSLAEVEDWTPEHWCFAIMRAFASAIIMSCWGILMLFGVCILNLPLLVVKMVGTFAEHDHSVGRRVEMRMPGVEWRVPAKERRVERGVPVMESPWRVPATDGRMEMAVPALDIELDSESEEEEEYEDCMPKTPLQTGKDEQEELSEEDRQEAPEAESPAKAVPKVEERLMWGKVPVSKNLYRFKNRVAHILKR